MKSLRSYFPLLLVLASPLNSLHAQPDSLELQLKGRWPSFPREISPTEIAVSGNHVYVAGLDIFQVMDLNEPAHPTLVAGLRTRRSIRAMEVSASVALVSTYPPAHGLEIIDVSNPAAPRWSAFWGITNSGVVDFALDENMAYILDFDSDGNGGTFMRVIDLSDPSNPVQLGSLRTTHGRAIGATGDLVFVAVSDKEYLSIIDVSDPANPVRVSVLRIESDDKVPSDLRAMNDLVFITVHEELSDWKTLDVVDVSVPEDPVLVGGLGFITEGRPRIIDVLANQLYLQPDASSEVQVVDVADPSRPVNIGPLQTDPWFRDLAVFSELLLMAYPNRVEVVNASDPSDTLQVGSIFTEGIGLDVAVVGDMAYLADGPAGLKVIDGSDPLNPRQIGSLAGDESFHGIELAANLAFLSGQESFVVVDVSDPDNPSRMGALENMQSQDFEVAGGLVMMAGFDSDTEEGGLHVIDVSDGANPVRTGFFDTPGFAAEIETVGNLAYVAGNAMDQNYLSVIDVSDPANPRWLGDLVLDEPEGGVPNALEATENLAFWSIDGLPHVSVIDVSNPADLQVIGRVQDLSDVAVIQSLGSLVLVGNLQDGLRVFDVSDPTNPAFLGGLSTIGTGGCVQVDGSYLVVADQSWGGLAFIEITPNLFISRDGENALLSWQDLPEVDFYLEETSKLSTPDWNAASNATTTPVILPFSTGSRFFRLTSP